MQGYLSRSAHNAVIDFYRLRNNAPEFVELDAPSMDGDKATVGELIAADAMPPDELALQAETVREVRRAMNALTDEQRFVLGGVLDGYEHKELSKALGKKTSATKSLYFRAYQSLKRAFLPKPPKPVKPPQPAKKRVERIKRVVVRKIDPMEKKSMRIVLEFRDALLEHGPQSALGLSTLTNARYSNVFRSLARYESVFTVVSLGAINQDKDTKIWGVRGVHDVHEVQR